ncbi:MAG: ribonuclease P protein component [Proteobacteria bacterium]|nr:ribonuclease P protein component [Pseudomonadota bacterium]
MVDNIAGESFPKRLRLSSASDYRQVFNNNFRVGDACITMLVRGCSGAYPRLGFAIARKQIHKAAQRNRIKRVIRESFRKNQHRLPARDMVIMVRRPILSIAGPELNINLEKHWNSVIKQCKNS